jgi:RHS repeat-associated protein
VFVASISHVYDLAGNQTIFDDGTLRRYYSTYNNAGQLATLETGPGGQPNDATLISNATYYPDGSESLADFGNGSEERLTKDNRSRLTGFGLYQAPSSFTAIAGWKYQYNPNNNVSTLQDNYIMGNWTYTYDDLNRLSTATAAPPYSGWDMNGIENIGCQYTYDRYGNRLSEQPYGTDKTCISTAMTYVNNQIAPPNAVVDAAGNVIQDLQGNLYTYDAENRIASVTSRISGATVTTNYQYSPEGRRISSTSGGATTIYNYDESGNFLWVNQGATTPHNIYANGRHFGYLYVNSDRSLNRVLYSSVDGVGTERLRVEQNQAIYNKSASGPFGEPLYSSGTNDDTIHFTGKERDTESGLDYFGARYYGSNMGRFMSPDDGTDQDLFEPQSWNLYSYVRNNPLTSVDADGKQVTVCSFVTNSDGSTGESCNTISDAAYAAGVAAQQAQNANNAPYSGIQAPGGIQPNGVITCDGQACGTAAWSPDPPSNMASGEAIPGDLGLRFVAGGMAADFVGDNVVGAIGSMLGRGAGDIAAAAGGASKALLTDGTKQAAKNIVDGIADGAQKASAKRMLNAIQPGQEISISLKSDGTLLISATRP